MEWEPTVSYITSGPSPYYLIRGNRSKTDFPVPNPSRIVLLHGFLQSHSSWISTAKKISKKYGHDIVLLDFYGHGDNALFLQDFRKFNSEILVEQVRNVVLHLGWDKGKIVMAGISLGGAVAQFYYSLYPDNVSRLVLIAFSGQSESVLKITSLCKYLLILPFHKLFLYLAKSNFFLDALNNYPLVIVSSYINLLADVPEYRVPQDMPQRLANTPLTLLGGGLDEFHSLHLKRWKSVQRNAPLNIKVYPWSTHGGICLFIDQLELDTYPMIWHDVAVRAKL